MLALVYLTCNTEFAHHNGPCETCRDRRLMPDTNCSSSAAGVVWQYARLFANESGGPKISAENFLLCFYKPGFLLKLILLKGEIQCNSIHSLFV